MEHIALELPAASSRHGVSLWVGRLAAPDRALLLGHYQRLSDDDLRLRFGHRMTALGLASYVAGLDLEAATCFGAMTPQGTLVAMIEGFPFELQGRGHMEVALSTHVEWRRLGVASALFRTLRVEASRRGVAEIVASCDARNGSMRSVMRATAAVTTVDADDVLARWTAVSSPMGPVEAVPA